MTRRHFTRRQVLLGAPALLVPPSRDIKISEVDTAFEDYLYRTPYKFGGTEVDRVTLLNVNCSVTGRDGKTASGFGSMTMGNVWSFPSKVLRYDQTLQAMKSLAARIMALTAAYRE